MAKKKRNAQRQPENREEEISAQQLCSMDLPNAPSIVSSIESYTGVPAVDRQLAKYYVAITASMGTIIGGIVDIGNNLLEVHELLSHHGDGTFLQWITERCRFSAQSARNYMAAATFAQRVSQSLLPTFSAEAFYFLGRKATPARAITAAIRLAEKGTFVTKAEAKRIVAKYSQKNTKAKRDNEADAESTANSSDHGQEEEATDETANEDPSETDQSADYENGNEPGATADESHLACFERQVRAAVDDWKFLSGEEEVAEFPRILRELAAELEQTQRAEW